MFVDQWLVSLFFRLLNFIILGGAGVYFFRRYGLPVVYKGIKEREVIIAGLKEQRDVLKDELIDLEQRAIDQQQLSSHLMAKIDKWQQAHARLEHRKYEEKQRLITLLTKRTHQQSQEIALQAMRQQLFPLIMQKSRQQLIEHFASPVVGQAYLQGLLTFMEKGRL